MGRKKNKKKDKKRSHVGSRIRDSSSGSHSIPKSHKDKSNKMAPTSAMLTQTTYNTFKANKLMPNTGTELKKAIVDLSKTKKRKEFEHDMKIQQKVTILHSVSQSSEHQVKQTRKVGKKIIGEIEAQI